MSTAGSLCGLILFLNVEEVISPFISNLGNGAISQGTSALHSTQHLKKEARAKPPFRHCQRISNDSHTGRLQLLYHQTTIIATLRLDCPTNAGLPTDHVIGQVPQPALQTLHSFIRYPPHSQGRAQHLCSVEEIAFQLTAIY